MLCTKIQQHDDAIAAVDYRFLLAGGPGLGSPSVPNPAPDWLGDKAWADINDLDKLPDFEGLAHNFAANISVSTPISGLIFTISEKLPPP